MKRYAVAYLVTILAILAFSESVAMGVTSYIDRIYIWFDGGVPSLKIDCPFVFEIQIDNSDEFDRTIIRLPLIFYSPDGISQIQHLDIGAFGTTGSIELSNGFEPGGFWDLTNQFDEFEWGGDLPDGICYTASASPMAGFPGNSGLSTRISFHMQVNEEGTLCLDSTGFGGPYDWLFESPSPTFNGPHCWPITSYFYLPIQITNCPTSAHVVPYNEQISLWFYAQCVDENCIDIYFYLRGPGEIANQEDHGFSAEAYWIYNPDISEAGDTLDATIGAADMFRTPASGIGCEFRVIIASACGDINGDMNVNILDVSTIIDYLYKDGPAPNYYYHSDVDLSENINVLDATYLINYLYKSGPEPVCRRIRDDFPASPGFWWKYERYNDLTAQYDTILVSMTDRSTRTLTFSDTTLTQTVDIRADTVLCTGIYPDAMSIFPLSVGSNWANESNNSADTVISMSVASVPAGDFGETYQIRRRWNCDENCLAVHNEWFVRGVGAVRLSMQQYHAVEGTQIDEMWELIEYSID